MKRELEKTIHDINAANLQYKLDETLAKYTTWKIGGPAEILILVHTIDEIEKIKAIANSNNIPLTILGSGSNILISDDGIKGIVVINQINHIKINDISIDNNMEMDLNLNSTMPRLNQIQTDKYYSFDKHDYDESDKPKATITVGSGCYLPLLINQTINNGLTGLQWFSGIPGTLGGAIYNNIHGGSHYISEFIKSVLIIDQIGQIRRLNKAECKFDYDYSVFHKTNFTIIEAELILHKGDLNRARGVAMQWSHDKKDTQPYNSAGCCFQNITQEQIEKLDIPTGSWGYIIEHLLNLKGKQIGQAIISTKHAAFIENLGNASAKDVISLIDLVYSESINKLNIKPKLEIFLIGFPEEFTNKYNP